MTLFGWGYVTVTILILARASSSLPQNPIPKLPILWGANYDTSTQPPETTTTVGIEEPTTQDYNATTAADDAEDDYNAEADIIFTLYTNAGRDMGQVISWNDSSWITESAFDPGNPLRVTVHGWQGDNTSDVNTGVRSALFQKGQFNVIVVNWSSGAATLNYLAARNRVEPTGKVLAELLAMIANNTGMAYSSMSVIGHSLGGHVAGFAGKNLDGQLGSIMALDPAAPFFSVENPEQRLNATDAQYVQVIHTDGGLKGIDVPIGDSDFYPNGGRSQPGCGIDLFGTCAHGRAVTYYVESITSTIGFFARRCGNYSDVVENRCGTNGTGVLMGGEPLDSSALGLFYLTTNDKSPFAKGES